MKQGYHVASSVDLNVGLWLKGDETVKVKEKLLAFHESGYISGDEWAKIQKGDRIGFVHHNMTTQVSLLAVCWFRMLTFINLKLL